MADLESIKRQDVLKAIEEYDELGPDRFLDTYGLRPAGEHVVLHDGHRYDTKAVVGVAHRFTTGRSLDGEEFSGGNDGAARVLRGLGFEVEGPDLPRLLYTNAATVGHEHARATWALAARERLLEAAMRYHAVVSQSELGDFVQRRSLIRTGQAAQHWIGDVLHRVSSECSSRREPLLSALCVDNHGRV